MVLGLILYSIIYRILQLINITFLPFFICISQVNWDEFQVSQIPRRVNPWWVELISHKPAPTPFPQTKKFRTTQSSAQLSDKKETLLNDDGFPVDVQRVRHDLVSISGPIHSHIILNSSETKFPATHNCNTKNDSDGSIMLFGKIIQPHVSNFHNSHMKGDDGYKSCGFGVKNQLIGAEPNTRLQGSCLHKS